MSPRVTINHERIADFCRRWKVAELSLFGSVLREDFNPERSDIDVLIELQSDAHVGLFELTDMQDELEALFGRKVDLVTKPALKPRIRQSILDSSEVLYAAA